MTVCNHIKMTETLEKKHQQFNVCCKECYKNELLAKKLTVKRNNEFGIEMNKLHIEIIA